MLFRLKQPSLPESKDNETWGSRRDVGEKMIQCIFETLWESIRNFLLSFALLSKDMKSVFLTCVWFCRQSALRKKEEKWKRRTGCVAITIIDEGCFLLANQNTSLLPTEREREMFIHVDTNWINTIHMYTKSHTFIQINIRKHTKINIYEDLFHCVLCQCKLVVSLKVLNIYSSPYSWHHRRQNRHTVYIWHTDKQTGKQRYSSQLRCV